MIKKLSDPIFIDRLVRDGIRKFSHSLPSYGLNVLLALRFALSYSFFGSIVDVPKKQFVSRLQNGDFALSLGMRDHGIRFRLAFPTYVSGFSEKANLVSHGFD